MCAEYESTPRQPEMHKGKYKYHRNRNCDAEIAPKIQDTPKAGMRSSDNRVHQASREKFDNPAFRDSCARRGKPKGNILMRQQPQKSINCLKSATCTNLFFQAPLLLVCIPPQRHNFAFGRHPTTLLQSHAVQLLTGDNCTALGVSRHVKCNGVTVDQQYSTALLLSNRSYATY